MFYDDDDLNSVKKLCIFRSDISSRCRLELPHNPGGIHLKSLMSTLIFIKKREKNNNTTRHKKSFPDEDTVQFKCDCGLPSIEIDFLPAGGTRTFSKPAHCCTVNNTNEICFQAISSKKLKLLLKDRGKTLLQPNRVQPNPTSNPHTTGR